MRLIVSYLKSLSLIKNFMHAFLFPRIKKHIKAALFRRKMKRVFLQESHDAVDLPWNIFQFQQISSALRMSLSLQSQNSLVLASSAANEPVFH